MKVMKPSVDTDVEHYEGVVLGGGWEHDELNYPCPSVQIAVNMHHLTLTDTVQAWNLEEFDGAYDPDDEFRRAFGSAYGDDAEFDYDILRDFRKTLERVGSERIAEVYGGKAIPMRIYHFPPDKEYS